MKGLSVDEPPATRRSVHYDPAVFQASTQAPPETDEEDDNDDDIPYHCIRAHRLSFQNSGSQKLCAATLMRATVILSVHAWGHGKNRAQFEPATLIYIVTLTRMEIWTRTKQKKTPAGNIEVKYVFLLRRSSPHTAFSRQELVVLLFLALVLLPRQRRLPPQLFLRNPPGLRASS